MPGFPSAVLPRVAVLALLAVAAFLLTPACGPASDEARAVATTPAVAPPAAPAAIPQRPNIVYVLTDDLTADLLPYMPTVRALQRRGVTFSNFIVSDSLCCPARATLLSGRYPHSTKVRTNVRPTGGWHVFHDRGLERSTYATDLHNRGYRTAMLGKYLNEYQPSSGYVPPGWDLWAVSGKGYHNFDYNLNVNGRLLQYGRRSRDYLTDVMARRSVQFIRRSVRDRRPFFVELSTFAPHGPAVPAPRDRRKFPGLRAPRTGAWDKTIENGPSWLKGRRALDARQVAALDLRFRRRARSVVAVDRMLRRVMRTVRRTGQANRTYVIFNSDNGFHLGQHRLMPGKMTAFDYDVRVPLIVRGPGVPARTTVDALTQNVDIRPTLAALAGTRPGSRVQGRSLVPFLRGQRPDRWRQTALIEHRGPDLDPSDPDYQAAPGGNPVTYEAIRFDGGLYVESANGEREYYDLERDPDGLVNAYGTLSAEQRRELAARVRRLARCTAVKACFDDAPRRERR